MAAFGKIPKGCHIHHRDGNVLNNKLDNLECIPSSEHLSITWEAHKADRTEHFTEDARERAAAWHRSEEGRLWHKRHAERAKSWTKWKRERKPCLHCGKEFDALVRASGYSQKFCSNACKAAYYRKRKASGS
ncbi:MAG: HNH endonuclease signature motif containing protein [Rhodospirillaceae bacterium]